jgi:hypothetical protein
VLHNFNRLHVIQRHTQSADRDIRSQAISCVTRITASKRNQA